MEAQKATATDEVPRVKLWHIARTFLGIGLASFSLAALGEAKNWMTKKRRWFSDEEYMQGLGLAQLMPGAPTVNLSSYLGFRLRGLPGAAAATVCFLIPCFLLMLLLSHLYLNYGDMPVVSGLFRGLGALVVGLVFNTILNLWRSGVKTIFNWMMAIIGFAMVFWFKMGVIKILLIAGRRQPDNGFAESPLSSVDPLDGQLERSLEKERQAIRQPRQRCSQTDPAGAAASKSNPQQTTPASQEVVEDKKPASCRRR